MSLHTYQKMQGFNFMNLRMFIIVFHRLVKEKLMYEKEAKQQEEKVEKMKAEGGDHYVVKKQVSLIVSLVLYLKTAMCS